MAQDMRPTVGWTKTLKISALTCSAFIGLDWLHFLFFGTKFTYLLNPASPTATFDFFYYVFIFAGIGFLIGIIFEMESKGAVVAGMLGPFLFLIVNGFILHYLLILNPAYANQLIPDWQLRFGPNPDWNALLPLNIPSFWVMYLNSFVLFFVLAFPFILATTFSGHTIREIS